MPSRALDHRHKHHARRVVQALPRTSYGRASCGQKGSGVNPDFIQGLSDVRDAHRAVGPFIVLHPEVGDEGAEYFVRAELEALGTVRDLVAA